MFLIMATCIMIKPSLKHKLQFPFCFFQYCHDLEIRSRSPRLACNCNATSLSNHHEKFKRSPFNNIQDKSFSLSLEIYHLSPIKYCACSCQEMYLFSNEIYVKSRKGFKPFVSSKRKDKSLSDLCLMQKQGENVSLQHSV